MVPILSSGENRSKSYSWISRSFSRGMVQLSSNILGVRGLETAETVDRAIHGLPVQLLGPLFGHGEYGEQSLRWLSPAKNYPQGWQEVTFDRPGLWDPKLLSQGKRLRGRVELTTLRLPSPESVRPPC